MLWLEDVRAQHSQCRTCTSLRKYKQNPVNRSGATLTWLAVGVGLHKLSLSPMSFTASCRLPKLCLSICERGFFCLLSLGLNLSSHVARSNFHPHATPPDCGHADYKQIRALRVSWFAFECSLILGLLSFLCPCRWLTL